MRLFSYDFIAELSQRYDGQPEFQMLPLYRIATAPRCQPIRDMLERWLEAVCPATRSNLVDRLRNPEQFAGAKNELLMACYLTKCGFSVIHSPEIQDQTPDFLIGDSARGKAVVEVFTREPSDKEKDVIKSKRELEWRMRKLKFRYSISINYNSLDAALSRDEMLNILDSLMKWIRDWGPIPGDRIAINNIRFMVDPLISKSGFCKTGAVTNGFREVNYFDTINDVKKKIKRYKTICKEYKLPMVVAFALDSTMFMFDDDDFDEMCLGKEKIFIPMVPGGGLLRYMNAQVYHGRNGLFTKPYRSLSALLWMQEKGGRPVMRRKGVNPNARFGLPDAIDAYLN